MKQHLRSLISQGKTAQALAQLAKLAKSDRDIHHQVLVLSARYEQYVREKNLGTSHTDNSQIELNRIHSAALELIERLPEKSAGNTKNRWKQVILWLGILGSIASIVGFSLRDYFKPTVENIEEKPLSPVIDSTTLTLNPEERLVIEPEPSAPSNQVDIQVNDQGKVGNVITGDSNTFQIKQEF